MEILIGADLVPTQSNFEDFIQGTMENVVDKELMNILNGADFRIFNLETPLSDIVNPIKKCGPHLIAPTKTINGITQLKVDFFTLANNHILDQGEKGLLSTMEILEKNNILYAGVGRNFEESSKPAILNIGSIKVGIYCCAEHEFSIVDENKMGANPFDLLESFEHIKQLKECVDYVIVLYHGGKEQYRYPSPNLQKVCRKIAENGADLVICQHTHCIGCKELWHDATIIYGQGNFLFDDSEDEHWETSLLVRLIVEKNRETHLEYIPIKKDGKGIRLAKDLCGKSIIDNFNNRSKEIQNNDFIKKEYKKYSEKIALDYYNRSLGKIRKSIIFKALNKLCSNKLVEQNYLGSNARALINVIECEAHRELYLEILKNNISK